MLQSFDQHTSGVFHSGESHSAKTVATENLLVHPFEEGELKHNFNDTAKTDKGNHWQGATPGHQGTKGKRKR